MILRISIIALVLILAFPALGQEGPELYRIRVINRVDGDVAISRDKGKSWENIGKVIYPTDKVNRKGYTAVEWVGSWEVAASAVNAIHIKTSDPTTIFSILPRDMLLPLGRYNSYLSPGASIYTDIRAGKLIFGGHLSPYVGNPVEVYGKRYYGSDIPEIGNYIDILVEPPSKAIQEIIIENRFGGRVTALYADGEEKVIAEVLRPVMGVGRFPGSKYLGPGRVRAAHAGVIEVSTSLGEDVVGGFQILPAHHAMSPEMKNARLKTQWMVLGPRDVEGEQLHGQPPLFRGFIRPDYEMEDLSYPDWEKRLLDRFLVEVRYNGKEEWSPMPVINLYPNEDLPEWADSALQNITHFRILFPVL